MIEKKRKKKKQVLAAHRFSNIVQDKTTIKKQ